MNSRYDITYIETDQNWADETTNTWFSVSLNDESAERHGVDPINGETYALSDTNGELQLLDSDGCPIDECNEPRRLKDELTALYNKANEFLS